MGEEAEDQEGRFGRGGVKNWINAKKKSRISK